SPRTSPGASPHPGGPDTPKVRPDNGECYPGKGETFPKHGSAPGSPSHRNGPGGTGPEEGDEAGFGCASPPATTQTTQPRTFTCRTPAQRAARPEHFRPGTCRFQLGPHPSRCSSAPGRGARCSATGAVHVPGAPQATGSQHHART